MFKRISSFFRSVSALGINKDISYLDKLKIQLVNRGALIAIGIASFFQLKRFNLLLQGTTPVDPYTPSIGLAFALLILYLNYKKQFRLTRFILTRLFPVFLLILYVLYGDFLKIDYAFLAFVFVGVLFYKTSRGRIIHFAYVLTLHLIGIYSININGPFLTLNYYHVIDPFIVTIGITIILIATVLFLIKEAEHNFLEQLKLNSILSKQNNNLKELVAQNDNKNRLFGIIAHDLKGPATAFNNLTKKISYLIKKESPERILEMADHFENSGTNLFYVLDNLLNWTISQKDGIRQNPENVKFYSLIEKVIQKLTQHTKKKNIKIENQVSVNAFGFVDTNILNIIFHNILHNACKFHEYND